MISFPLNLLFLLAAFSQMAQTQTSEQGDPLISQSGNTAIYIGIFLLIAAISLAIGTINHKIEYALLFAFTLAVVMTVVLWNL